MSTTTLPTTEELRATFTHVARALGPGWSMTTTERAYERDICDLAGPGRAVINVRTEYGKVGRLCIQGSGERIAAAYIHDSVSSVYKMDNPSITVAMTRSALDIAGEVIRRILPEYLTWLVAIEERSIAQREQREARDALALRLATIGHCRHGEMTEDGDRRISIYPDMGTGYGHIEVGSGNGHPYVEMKLSSISPALAERLMAVMAAETQPAAEEEAG